MRPLGRQLRLVFAGTVLVVAAFSTGIDFLFFLVYLLAILLIAAWVYSRRGLTGVRAGYHVVNPRAHVGETLQGIYRVDNDAGWAKPWVELWNDSNLPAALPGRVVGVRARGSRQWLAKVTLLRRGSFRMGPLRVRTGDPFGLFTSEMVVGRPANIIVFPKVVELPHWRLPPSPLEGNTTARRRIDASSPLVRTVRPYVHGDAINKIHWLSSARHAELLVKEFDVEQTADVWIVLDLDRSAHAGVGDSASVETAVTAAASIALRTLADNRSVAMTITSRRIQLLQPDRGPRVQQKVLHLLASVQADGSHPLSEVVLSTLPRLKRGMTLCLITGSTEREWVRPLAALRRRGIGVVTVLLDRASFVGRDDPDSRGELVAVRHALAEYGVEHHLVAAGADLAEVLGTRTPVHA